MSLITPDHSLDASLDALGPLVARTAVAAAGVAPGRVGLPPPARAGVARRDATGRRVLLSAESGGGG
jgi:hypothetical protein